jgi:hypothetical protein
MRNILSALFAITLIPQLMFGQGANSRTAISLIATGADLDAAGTATIAIHSGGPQEQSFKVHVSNLGVATAYKVFVDGVELGTFTTDNTGGAQVRFSTDPKGPEQLLPAVLTPVSNIKLVEIKAADGTVVLTGSF